MNVIELEAKQMKIQRIQSVIQDSSLLSEQCCDKVLNKIEEILCRHVEKADRCSNTVDSGL